MFYFVNFLVLQYNYSQNSMRDFSLKLQLIRPLIIHLNSKIFYNYENKNMNSFKDKLRKLAITV